VIDRKYRIDGALGKGGMGSVFLATHLGTGREVAVKLISQEPAGSPEFEARFRREARALGRLRHPNVVNITDFGVSSWPAGETAYIVMEYLDGSTLAAYQRDHGAVPVRMILDVLDQVAAALDAAHRAGIVHRDLKPENIWLQPNGRGFHVKVLDFGIAKMMNPQTDEPTEAGGDSDPTRTMGSVNAPGSTTQVTRTARGRTVGTPAYMSPEQCRGERLDARSDIYSLGVIAYYLLCGELPFSGTSIELMGKHVYAAPPPLHGRRKGISRAVEAVVLSALEKDRQLRPPSATAFASRFRTAAELERSFLAKARMVIAASAQVSFALFLIPVLVTIPLGTIWLNTTAAYPAGWRDALAVLGLLALALIAGNFAKAAWALVHLETLTHGQQNVSVRRVLAVFATRFPGLMATQIVALTRSPLAAGSGLWPVVCAVEGLVGSAAVSRSLALTAPAQKAVTALSIRQFAVALVGVIYGTNVLPVMGDSGGFSDLGFQFFQAFTVFIVAMPMSTGILAAFSAAFFRGRSLLGEAPEPAVSFEDAPEFPGNRIPVWTRQSKLWMAASAATLIVGVVAGYHLKLQGGKSATARLISAVELGRVGAVQRLLRETDANAMNGNWSPLPRAVLWGQEQVVDTLLAAGADVNLSSPYVGSALYLAVAARRDRLVSKLLDRGANPNTAPAWGLTPLMVAAMQGNSDVVRLLLDRGADPARLHPDGQRAADFAREEGYVEVANLLERTKGEYDR
jgi:hypothetical protein